MPTALRRAALAALFGLSLTGFAAAQNGSVNIYSYRSPDLIAPLLDRFEEETGIKPVVLFANNGLIERAAAEGENSPADLILTVDIGNLALAKSEGVTQPIPEAALENVPDAYRDAEGHWTALSLRARVFYVSKDRVDAQALSYADIADPEWKGRVCTRSGQHVYNIGLIASRIAHMGEDGARTWLEGVRDNLTGAPTGNDRAQVKSIYSGECDLAIGNTYYMGLMLNNEEEPEQKDWAASVRIIYPDADGTGTHVNVSGAILAKHAPNKDNAEKLIEFLLSEEAQEIYASTNHEFPVVPGVPLSETVASWGELKADDTPLTEIAALRDAASRLVDETRFDEGPQN
ncbi:extracellular solute-binding protein [Cucumibacter marinus]|uniref:extracellular solute-binding protein n=1 Tax=Cucumibacter marinus TaxID=1121252 RepID=UPI000414012B|nr:extracellular solute-binding protein [Cucumibacter marinus]